MQIIASLPMWTNFRRGRSCRIRVQADSRAIVDMHANGEHVFSRDCDSLSHAFDLASALRRLHPDTAPAQPAAAAVNPAMVWAA